LTGGVFPQPGNCPGMRFSLILCAIFGTCLGSARPDTVCDVVARRVFELSNQTRQKNSVAPLVWDDVMAKAANTQSQDMCKFDFFDHDSPVPERHTVAERVLQAGGLISAVGENIYWSNGYPPEQVPAMAIADWLTDPGHRDNLLSTNFHLLGVGVYRDKKAFWVTQVFSD